LSFHYRPLFTKVGRWIQPDRLVMFESKSIASQPELLSVYSYAANNPIKFIDLKGLKMSVAAGSAADIHTFKTQIENATGFTIANVGGLLKIHGKRNSSVGSALAARVVRLAINSVDTIHVDLVNANPTILIDAFASNKIDVADLQGFFNKSNQLGASALVHILTERASAITKGIATPPTDPANYPAAHASALTVESQVMGASSRSVTPTGTGFIVEFKDAAGATVKAFAFTQDASKTPK